MSLIIVADTHVKPGSAAEQAFFDMLEKLGNSRYDIVFLGDIFDLWIGLPGYEGASQAQFLDWCRQQKRSKCIGFIEGNHEFFVSEKHGDNFSWSTSESSWRDVDGHLFVHGDQINSRDHRYLIFRRLTKNPLTKMLLKFLPGGPQVCRRINKALQNSNPNHRQGLPQTQIKRYAREMFDDSLKTIFVGHFHSEYKYEHTSTQFLYLLPAWFDSGKLTRVDVQNTQRMVEFVNWEELAY